ncbi:MAG: cytochrome c biogenesis heme-transporting ATPase CcmA [Proteobacteria bacterium]|nr:cytochrome c biogenesis heme-transporting ATPase CcmA [Pseudomonadota bacterium]
MNDSGLDVRDLRVERGERVLFEHLSFAAPPASVVHLVGANGSGKTTLMKTLAGLVTPDAGEIHWRGALLTRAADFRAALNYIGHHGGLNTELTPYENLEFIATLCAAPRRGSIAAALRALNAAGFAERPVRYLSAGQRQRVTLARLILFDAPLWMLDEPFTALDHASRALVESIIDAHVDHGGTVLIATHQSFASRHAIRAVPLAEAQP